mgnify:CR=1 FL=1
MHLGFKVAAFLKSRDASVSVKVKGYDEDACRTAVQLNVAAAPVQEYTTVPSSIILSFKLELILGIELSVEPFGQ